jgi:hypothetical protein
MATKLNVAYIKTAGANTYDVLRVGTSGNLEYTNAGLVYANTQVITGASNYVNYNLNSYGATNTSIIVSIEGLIQIPGVDYFVTGQTLTLTSNPDPNANIEVRYLGSAAVSQFSPLTSMDVISSFLLMGA